MSDSTIMVTKRNRELGEIREILKKTRERYIGISLSNSKNNVKIVFMKRLTTVRCMYLNILRSVVINKYDNNILWYRAYRKAIDDKIVLQDKIDHHSNGYNNEQIRYMKLAKVTLDKYITVYLKRKTAVSVEILRAIRCKYIDRYIMGFL